MIPNNHGSCDEVACPKDCKECAWDPNLEKLICSLCFNEIVKNEIGEDELKRFRLNEDNECKPTTCNENQFINNDRCTECNSLCAQCESTNVCLDC